MKYLLLSLLVLSTSSFAAEKKVVAQTTTKTKAATTDKTLDVTPESKTQEVADETALYTEKHMMKAKVSCKAKDGHELKQGDKGYEECLKKVKGKDSDVKVEFEKQQ